MNIHCTIKIILLAFQFKKKTFFLALLKIRAKINYLYLISVRGLILIMHYKLLHPFTLILFYKSRLIYNFLANSQRKDAT